MNAQTLIATSALAALFATTTTAQARDMTGLTSTRAAETLVESYATTDLRGSYIDLKPIGVVETDSAGFTSLKPIGYWATAPDGSVELKPIGSEYADSYDFEWTVELADVSSSFRDAGTDLAGLKPIGIIELGDDGLVGLKPIGIEETGADGYTDLKPIGLDYQDGDVIGLKPIGSESTDMIGLKPIGIVSTDSDGYIDLQDMGEVNLESHGSIELPAASTTSTVDYSSYTTSERLLRGDR